MTVTIERPCRDVFTHAEHPQHPWNGATAHWWCPGWPRQLRPVNGTASEAPCPATVTVGSSDFICARTEHYTEPGGYGGTGHTWIGRRG